MSASIIDLPPRNLLKTQSYTSNGSFTVPAGVTELLLFGAGGGGGGGGSPTVESSRVGYPGAGGSGAVPSFVSLTVVPGEVYTVTVGAGGAGGGPDGTNSPATNGATGGNTTFTKVGVNIVFTGAPGGQGGTVDDALVDDPAIPGNSSQWSPTLQRSGSGGGGLPGWSTPSPGTNGQPGANTIYATGGLGGDNDANGGGNFGGGGGGGGGAGFGNGGNGAGGRSYDGGTPVNAAAGSSGGLSAGGGGAGGHAATSGDTSLGASGGNGGGGFLDVMFVEVN